LTEVPDYLLERSQERRRALGLLSDEGAPTTASTADAASGAPAPGVAATPAPAPVVVAPPVEVPKPLSPAAQAAMSRHKIPMWVMPVLFLLPVWGLTYVQLLEDDAAVEVTALSRGAQVYTSAACAACHGSGGSGGVGYQLNDGEVLLTFAEIDPMIEWITAGTTEWGIGNPIGDPNRPGGQRIAGDRDVMPGFVSSLDASDIYAVTRFVREQLGGEVLTAEQADDREATWKELGGGASTGGGGGGSGHN